MSEVEIPALSQPLRVLECLANPAQAQQETDQGNVDLLLVLQKTGTEAIFRNRGATVFERGDGPPVRFDCLIVALRGFKRLPLQKIDVPRQCGVSGVGK